VTIGDIIWPLAGEAADPQRIDTVWLPHTRPNAWGKTAGAKILLGSGVMLVECVIKAVFVLPGGAGETPVAGKAGNNANEA